MVLYGRKTQQNRHIAHARTHEEEAGNRAKLEELELPTRTHEREPSHLLQANKRTHWAHARTYARTKGGTNEHRGNTGKLGKTFGTLVFYTHARTRTKN